MIKLRLVINAISRRNFYFMSALCKNAVKVKEPVETPKEVFSSVMNNTFPKSVDEWTDIRRAVLDTGKLFTPQNVDFLTMAFCLSTNNYALGKSYLQFLETSNIKPNLATIARFFCLFYDSNKNKDVSSEDEELILKLIEDIRRSYDVFDSITCENALIALSLTRNWRECFKLLDEIKYTCPVPNSLPYSALVTAAFKNNKSEVGWKLLNEIIENNRFVFPEVYSAYINHYKGQRNFYNELEKLFSFFQSNDIKCNKVTAELIKNSFTNKSCIHSTVISNSGICKICKNKLQLLQVTEEEFNGIKKEFFENVIIGQNVFSKTNPKELARFKNFVSSMGKYDVIVDGLNVAYSSGNRKSPTLMSGLITAVVRHFVQQNKRVLVLGRSHMSRWPKPSLSYITANASLFLTEDISQDDPYLLYCALSSGMDTTIVTRDLMRGHIFLLKTPYYRSLFKRWFLQNQYYLVHVNNKGKAIFKVPLPYMTTAQKIGNIWHIPYNVDNDEAPELNWLCIKT